MARTILRSGIRKLNTIVKTDELGLRSCKLYDTVIARECSPESVELNTGGWDTPTTIRRMNECLHHWGYAVSVSKRDFAKSNTLVLVR